VQPTSTNQADIARVYAKFIKLLQQHLNSYLPKARLLFLRDITDGVIKGNGNLGFGAHQLG
jgi:hypothetical protein